MMLAVESGPAVSAKAIAAVVAASRAHKSDRAVAYEAAALAVEAEPAVSAKVAAAVLAAASRAHRSERAVAYGAAA